MNAQQFVAANTRERVQEVCDRAGTDILYFMQIAEGKRFPSRKLAERLEWASSSEMTRVELVFGSNPPPPLDPRSFESGHADAP